MLLFGGLPLVPSSDILFAKLFDDAHSGRYEDDQSHHRSGCKEGNLDPETAFSDPIDHLREARLLLLFYLHHFDFVLDKTRSPLRDDA